MTEPISAHRVEQDSLGEVDVPADRLWGAQTQRALENFPIGDRPMPRAVIRAFGIQKLAAARANVRVGVLPSDLGEAIARAAQAIAEGGYRDQFPLVVYQSGSGTQSNMNVNEVIANLANESLGAPRGAKVPVHPNDHVNLSQSTNDSFPTVMHIATVYDLNERLLPSLDGLGMALEEKSKAFAEIIKIGRTHLQDAVPMTVGQEFSGYMAQVRRSHGRLSDVADDLLAVPQGGTAIGTGLNAHPDFAPAFLAELNEITGFPFRPAGNTFAAIAAHDNLVEASGALNALAGALMKVANDIRLLGSGPRAGLRELVLPANEPGSSIMPGKVNPTQAEALTQVCAQVMGYHVAVTIAGASGHLELNAFKPVIIASVLESIGLLSDACASFAKRCVSDLAVDEARTRELVEASLMLVTALVPRLGYDAAAHLAREAHASGASLKATAVRHGLLAETEYDALVNLAAMVGSDTESD